MSFGLLAGIAGAFPAIQRGMDDQKARDQADEDRKFQLEQREAAKADRAFGLQQRDRQVAEQRRQDTLRDELAAMPQTREIDTRPAAIREITHDDTTGPPGSPEDTPSATQIPVMKTVAAPEWIKFKSTADIYRKNKDFEKADAYDAMSQKAQFAESAQRFHTIKAGSSTMSLEQLAKSAADIYNNDPLPAQIEGMKPVNGGMQFTFANKDTGESQTLVVKTKEELLEKLEAYYSKDTYAAYQASLRAAHLKAEETRASERAKPLVTNPGQTVTEVDANGRRVPTFTNGTPTAAQVRAAAGGAGGSGGKAPPTLYETSRKIMDDSFGKNETPAQVRADAENYLDRVIQTNPNIPAARAARLATVAATDSSRHVPHFNPVTGQIDIAVVDDDKKPYTITPNAFSTADVSSPEFAKRFPKADLKATAENLVRAASGGSAEREKAFRAAAFDPAAQKKFFDEAQADADKAIAEALAKNAKLQNPEPEEAIRARAQRGMEEWASNTTRKLELVSKFADRPKAEKKIEQKAAAGFGLAGSSPAPADAYLGLNSRQANELASRQVREARAGMPARSVVDRDAADRDPDVVRLRKEVQAALRANKGVEANNKLAEIKRIEQERYTSAK